MVDRNADTAEDKRIAFRVGVNLGDVIAEADDIYGDGVNIAARLEALAEPGGICISRVVRDQIRDKLPYPFEDMGEQSVKNIARPVRAYAMSAAAAASTQLPAESARPGASRRGTSRQRLLIAASVIAAIATGALAWWEWPKELRRLFLPSRPRPRTRKADPPLQSLHHAFHSSCCLLPIYREIRTRSISLIASPTI
jgi:hypothetical protein